MMRYQLYTLVLGLSVASLRLSAQDSIENVMMSMQEITTEIASRVDEGTDMDELADRILNLAENPIHINTADEEELEKLFWLNEFQIQNIRKYIKANGSIASIFEISYIEGFSEKDAKVLSPFMLFDVPRHEAEITPEIALKESHHRLLLRSQRVLETQKGYTTPETSGSGYFKGGPTSAYLRYSYQLNNRIFAGFTAKNDAGEEFFRGSNKQGFDFYSFYIQMNKVKFIKTLLIGDYRIYFGQGLAVWSGFNLGKSPVVMSSMQRNPGIARYQSSDENNFFRGSAVTLAFHPVEVTVWASRHSIDANVLDNDTIERGTQEVSSLQTSGLHTTNSEIADEDAIKASVVGGNILFVKPNLRIGTTGIYYAYSSFVNPELKPYNSYYFRGRSNFNLSCDFRYRAGNVILFGEEATSQNGAIAFLNGIQAYVNSRLSFTVVSRYYQRNYQAMYGNAFGENARNNNEAGLFAGLECKPFKYVTFSGYVDAFRFPWLTYGADMPSVGRDFLLQLTIDPTSRLQLYLQYRNKTKDDNFSSDTDAKNLISLTKQQRMRFNLSYVANSSITLRCRLELLQYTNEFSGTTKGFYLGQDVEFSLTRVPIRFFLRYAVFDTDDYNSRVYAYENDLLYTFSIPAYFNQGTRAYFMAKYSPSNHIDFWVKYGITQYANRETVSSGLYEIQGNQKSELKVQMMVKF